MRNEKKQALRFIGVNESCFFNPQYSQTTITSGLIIILFCSWPMHFKIQIFTHENTISWTSKYLVTLTQEYLIIKESTDKDEIGWTNGKAKLSLGVKKESQKDSKWNHVGFLSFHCRVAGKIKPFKASFKYKNIFFFF